MTTSEQPPTAPEPQPAAPSVRTAPAPAARWWSSVPRHLGRVRTSTLVLVLLWLAIFVLYVYVRPDPATTGVANTGSTGGSVRQPVPASRAPATTTPRRSTTAPAPTTSRTSRSGTSSAVSGATSPTDTATLQTTPPPTSLSPELPSGSGAPTT